jgi:hypothetical protein
MGQSPTSEGRDGADWKPTIGTWLVVLALTVATALYFKWKTPDAPLDASSLALVAFCWLLVAYSIRWLWKRRHRRPSAR